jgi:hypothetical protein
MPKWIRPHITLSKGTGLTVQPWEKLLGAVIRVENNGNTVYCGGENISERIGAG